jgi:Ca2+-binding EF-hand superfamily protein
MIADLAAADRSSSPNAFLVVESLIVFAADADETGTELWAIEREFCPGDCDGDGSVSIAELVRAVNLALGAGALHRCMDVDVNGDGAVAINELVRAVGSALDGC